MVGSTISSLLTSEAEANYLGKPLKTSVNKLDIVSLPCVNYYVMGRSEDVCLRPTLENQESCKDQFVCSRYKH